MALLQSVKNVHSESFNSRFYDELLHRKLFETLAEAKMLSEDYRLKDSHPQPHSALEYRTPAAFVHDVDGRTGALGGPRH
jgi:hypothetical protein